MTASTVVFSAFRIRMSRTFCIFTGRYEASNLWNTWWTRKRFFAFGIQEGSWCPLSAVTDARDPIISNDVFSKRTLGSAHRSSLVGICAAERQVWIRAAWRRTSFYDKNTIKILINLSPVSYAVSSVSL